MTTVIRRPISNFSCPSDILKSTIQQTAPIAWRFCFELFSQVIPPRACLAVSNVPRVDCGLLFVVNIKKATGGYEHVF
jgi:hypothetical protein